MILITSVFIDIQFYVFVQLSLLSWFVVFEKIRVSQWMGTNNNPWSPWYFSPGLFLMELPSLLSLLLIFVRLACLFQSWGLSTTYIPMVRSFDNHKIRKARLLMFLLPPLPGTQGPPFFIFLFSSATTSATSSTPGCSWSPPTPPEDSMNEVWWWDTPTPVLPYLSFFRFFPVFFFLGFSCILLPQLL